MQCPIGSSALPLDIIYGAADDYVDPGAFPAGETVAAHMLPAADHFFSGQHDALATALTNILSSD
jgi:alpha/beta superfamily hydrolase